MGKTQQLTLQKIDAPANRPLIKTPHCKTFNGAMMESSSSIRCFLKNQRDVFAYSIDNKQMIKLTDDTNIEINPQYSPNNQFILFQEENNQTSDLIIIPYKGGSKINILSIPNDGRYIKHFGWLSINTIFYVSQNIVTIYDIRQKKSLATWTLNGLNRFYNFFTHPAQNQYICFVAKQGK